MSLVINRIGDETWRDVVIRMSSKYGLQDECLTIFDKEIASGTKESLAAFDALYEWDCTDYVEESPDASTPPEA